MARRAICTGDLPGDDRQGIDADLLAEHRELLHRRRTAGVERGHQRLAPHLLAEAPRDLGGGGGLAGALQADHHDRHRRRGIEIDRIGGGAERLDELVVDDLDDHLAGRDRLHDLDADRAFAHPVDEGAHHVERDVGFEQRAADLARRRVDIGRGERAAARQPVENAGQLVGQAFEHRSTPPYATHVKRQTRPRAHSAVGRWPPASRDRAAGRTTGSFRELRGDLRAGRRQVNRASQPRRPQPSRAARAIGTASRTRRASSPSLPARSAPGWNHPADPARPARRGWSCSSVPGEEMAGLHQFVVSGAGGDDLGDDGIIDRMDRRDGFHHGSVPTCHFPPSNCNFCTGTRFRYDYAVSRAAARPEPCSRCRHLVATCLRGSPAAAAFGGGAGWLRTRIAGLPRRAGVGSLRRNPVPRSPRRAARRAPSTCCGGSPLGRRRKMAGMGAEPLCGPSAGARRRNCDPDRLRRPCEPSHPDRAVSTCCAIRCGRSVPRRSALPGRNGSTIPASHSRRCRRSMRCWCPTATTIISMSRRCRGWPPPTGRASSRRSATTP